MPDYTSDAGLLSHLQKQNQTINEFKTQAGADADDVDSIEHDTANMEFAVELMPIATEFKESVSGVKRKLIRGEIGAPLGTIMAAPATVPPFALVAGIEKRSRERDQRFKRSKTMTEAALLGLDLVDTPGSISPGSVKPTVECFAAQSGYVFSVVIGNRGDSESADVLIRRAGSETVSVEKMFTGKSVDVTVAPTTPGQPEKLQVTIQLKKKNENYGQVSDAVSVTVNP
jgi:hypothetical protein